MSQDFIKAAELGYLNVVQDFLNNGVDVNLKNKRGETALIVASQNTRGTSSEEMVELLLSCSTIKTGIKDNEGNTALMWASHFANEYSTPNAVKILD